MDEKTDLDASLTCREDLISETSIQVVDCLACAELYMLIRRRFAVIGGITVTVIAPS